MAMWRAEFFYEKDDRTPARVELIEAKDESDAAKKAAALMNSSVRVDLTRTVLKPAHSE